jgi:hypothetical protein
VYSGALAQVPRNGGLTWFHLQFLVGLRRLGWNVLFLDWLDPAMCVDAAGRRTTLENSENLQYFLKVMQDFGLTECFSLNYNRGERVIGLSSATVHEIVRRSEFLFNVMGYLNDEAVLSRSRRRVFIDIDPGFGQMWRALDLHDAFSGHDVFVTLGRNIGQPNCAIPTCELSWITLAQPVVLSEWPVEPPCEHGAFTSIGAWRGPNAPIEYQGNLYGLRVHEFRKFVALPLSCRSSSFEQALEIHPAETADIALLREHGWKLVDPKTVAGGPKTYRRYIVESKAEFLVPKQIYVATRSGLLSDRSAYYLATGRPVLARDTGLGELYPLGDGLIAFSTLDEAVAGVEAIQHDYRRHCRAAREIAEEYFDSDKVLAKLLNDLNSTRNHTVTRRET